MDPVTLLVSNLNPLLGVLRSAYEQYQDVCHNREICLHLLKRSQKILVTIDSEIAKHGHPDGMKDNIDRLCGGLIHIRDIFSSFARLSFLKSLLRRNEISKAIVQCHDRLDDCLQCFNLTALMHLIHSQSEYDDARRKDTEFLESKITLYASHNQEALRDLKIQQRDMMDALLAMQRNLIHNQENSPESTILKIGIECVEHSSKLKARKDVPDWTVSSLEVDVDNEEELGSGGFSVVRKGTWNGLLVAVKMMTSETSPQALLRETRIWSQLSHENVLQFYGASLATDAPFIITRYMKNGNLLQYLRREPNSDRVRLIHDIALGMKYIHYKNIVHGDLKGANVLIDDVGKACVADFGLSKIKYDALSQSTTTKGQTPAGTIRFMAPEMMKGKVTKEGDVYSFAMLIYQLFTNEAPFHGVPEEVLFTLVGQQHQRLGQPTSEDAAKRGLTNDMWELLWKCSNPAPSGRPQFSNIIMATTELVKHWEPVAGGESAGEFNLFASLDGPFSNENTITPSAVTLRASDTTGKGQLLSTDRQLIKPKRPKTLRGHNGAVSALAFSPDGTRLASGSDDNTVRFWDPAIGANLFTLQGHTGLVSTVAFSPDGSRLVSGSHDGTIRLWDPVTGAHLVTLQAHTGLVSTVAFSPDGSRFVSGSNDGTIRLWDPVTGAHLVTLHSRSSVSPEGSRLASGYHDRTIHPWEPSRRDDLFMLQEQQVDNDPVFTVAFSSDGDRLASGSSDGTIGLWNPATGAHLFTLHGHASSVSAVAFSPNGSRLASGSHDNTINLRDPSTGAHLFTLRGHNSAVLSVAFSPDGARLGSGARDTTIRLWDPAKGIHLFTLEGHTSDVCAVSFSPNDAYIASGSYDRTIFIWECHYRRKVFGLLRDSFIRKS